MAPPRKIAARPLRMLERAFAESRRRCPIIRENPLSSTRSMVMRLHRVSFNPISAIEALTLWQASQHIH